jgi:hypothetical protein
MTDHDLGARFSTAIDELRRLAREPYEPSEELRRLRRRVSSARSRAHRGILERVARQANVDLQPIFEEAQRRNVVKRRYVTRTLKRLEAEVAERAQAQKKHFHRIRAEYVRAFSNLDQSTSRLKFHQPIASSASAHPGDCNAVIGYGCSPPNFGSHQASADIASDPVGIWLHPFIYGYSGDCDETLPGWTLQDLTYQMGPPATSFAVSSVRVDLLANGMGTSYIGDGPPLSEANPVYVHSFIQMDVYIAQQVNGEWHQWPLVSDRLFVGQGEYVRQIRPLLSGQTYPAAIMIRPPAGGGGEVLCHLQLVCSADTIGTDGQVGLNFRAPEHGIFVGGIALLGGFV